MTSPDLGREAVYAAEIAAFDGTSYESLTPFEDLQVLAASITAAPWWPHDPVEVVRARTDARSSVTRQQASGTPVVRLAVPQMTPATLVHELAHALAGLGEGHGPLFRRAHIDLAGFAFGGDAAGWLTDAYASMELPPGERRWPPPGTAHGAIAL